MDETSNIAAVLHGKEDLRMEDIGIPEIDDDEVLLSMGSVGICGSDIKYWKNGVCGRFILTSPMVIGHEASGVVAKVGDKVKHLKVGDRVAIEPGVPCRKCDLCKHGRYNLCPDIRFCATPPVDGNIARFYKHAGDFCFKLPYNVSLDEGAMLEPLAVAVYACERGGVVANSKVLVCGAGPVGVMAMLTAKVLGASSVFITDIDEHRLAMAKTLGADFTYKVTSRDHKAIARDIQAISGSHPDVSLECSGSDDSFNTSIFATRSGGCVVLVGRGSLHPTIPIIEAATREVDIKGVFRYANCYPKALSMVAQGLIDIKPLISHHFSLMDTQKAFDTAYSRDQRAVKVIIHCDS